MTTMTTMTTMQMVVVAVVCKPVQNSKQLTTMCIVASWLLCQADLADLALLVG